MSKWLREDAEAGDEAFFHCMHDDGDEEDLDEEEAVRGVLATTCTCTCLVALRCRKDSNRAP